MIFFTTCAQHKFLEALIGRHFSIIIANDDGINLMTTSERPQWVCPEIGHSKTSAKPDEPGHRTTFN
jgi:hypothetical protein